MAWSIRSPPRADRLGGHGVGQAHHGHLGGAAADVADHAGRRLGDGQADADRGGLGLGHDPHLAGPGAVDAVEDGPLLDRRDAAGHAHQHPRPQPPAGPLRLAEKIAQHRLAQLEVGDHAVAQRADDRDRVGRAAFHLLGQMAHRAAAGEDSARALLHGDDRGLVEHQSFADHADQRVGRAQIDGQVASGSGSGGLEVEHPCSQGVRG